MIESENKEQNNGAVVEDRIGLNSGCEEHRERKSEMRISY